MKNGRQKKKKKQLKREVWARNGKSQQQNVYQNKRWMLAGKIKVVVDKCVQYLTRFVVGFILFVCRLLCVASDFKPLLQVINFVWLCFWIIFILISKIILKKFKKYYFDIFLYKNTFKNNRNYNNNHLTITIAKYFYRLLGKMDNCNLSNNK